ncbi:MAG TPA: hypothetical protein DEQ14_11780 [Treponema sp.]|nr:hypothetical protein [Treponema sp.]
MTLFVILAKARISAREIPGQARNDIRLSRHPALMRYPPANYTVYIASLAEATLGFSGDCHRYYPAKPDGWGIAADRWRAAA